MMTQVKTGHDGGMVIMLLSVMVTILIVGVTWATMTLLVVVVVVPLV